MQKPKPVTLRNQWVTLKPLSLEHAAEYVEIGGDEDIWTYLVPEPFQVEEDARRWINAMITRADQVGDVSFSVYDNVSNRLAGSSSYLDVRFEHGGLEIGFTWYGKDFRRTHVNSATKLALLAHAFETLGANRVQLQTDARNQRSQTAIARIGALKEGVLRKHKVYPNGYVRDSVLFSITRDDWPEVKLKLEAFLT